MSLVRTILHRCCQSLRRKASCSRGQVESARETVKMTRLVEQLPVTQIEAPALLKIDVQGFWSYRR